MRRGALGAALSVGVALATTWPWARDPTRALGARDLEAADHLWALWLGGVDGPLVAQTALVGAPEGYTWVVGDPAHVPVFALGHALGGAGLGLGFVHLLALSLAALAGWFWARHLWPERPDIAVLAAPLAAAAPGLGVGLVTGMTEAQPLGMTALALLALHAAARDGGAMRAAACALAFGALPWFGAYPALYGVLLAPMVLVWGLARGPDRGRRAALVLGAAVAAALLAAPVLEAVLSVRDVGLPGGTALTPQILAEPELPRNRMLGADLMGLVLPGAGLHPTGVHGAYLGLGAVLAAAAGLASRAHRRGLPAALVLVAGVLSLGFTLQVGGEVLRIGDAPLLAPAGALSLLIEGLGRAPRWTRMAALGSILLAPLAAAGLEAMTSRGSPGLRAALLGLGLALLVGDATALGPAPFPRPTFDPAPPDALAELDGPGGLLEVPAPRYSSALPETGGGPRARLRHPTLVWQTGHGRALSGNPHQAGLPAGEGERIGQALLAAAMSGDQAATQRSRADATGAGFGWIVSWKGVSTGAERAALSASLGPPPIEGPALVAWPLTGP
jgi:hypothetical protein